MISRIISRVAPVTAVAIVAAGVLAPTARAHDQLVSTNPASGARLTTAPKDLSLTFNTSPLTMGNQISVRGPEGSAVPSTPKPSGRTLSVPFTAHGNGAYQVTWRVVSSDGHPISGSFRFTLAGEAASASSPPTTSGEARPAAPSQSVSPAQSPSATSTPTASATKTSGSKAGGWIMAFLGAVLLAAIGVFVVRRRGADQ